MCIPQCLATSTSGCAQFALALNLYASVAPKAITRDMDKDNFELVLTGLVVVILLPIIWEFVKH